MPSSFGTIPNQGAFEKTMKVVGYTRRSTDKQDQSLGDQRRELQRYADEKGFELVRFYEDDAISGTSAKGRDAFQDMIHDAEKDPVHPPFQAVLSWDVRRFSRGDNDEAGYYRFRLRKCGIDVIYITENFQGGDSDDLVLATKQWLARQER
jgi:DNA invertase Pin-like site-specific DNA recombinase